MRKIIKKILKEEQDLNWAQEAVSGELRPTRSLIVKPQAQTIKNAIETHTEVMHGDGDSYDKNIVIYYRDGKGRWNNDDWDSEFNFNDFERVVDFLRGNLKIDWENDEETEFFVDAGVIDYDEYADNGFEIGSINEVFYYDENGNKYKAKIDGVNTYHDDDDDYDDDEDEDDEEEDTCDICGGYDDTGTGVCSDCDEDDDDEEDDDYDDLDEDDLEGNGETDEPRVVRWNIPD